MCRGSWGHKDSDVTERLSSNSSNEQTASLGLRRERTGPPSRRPGFHPWVGNGNPLQILAWRIPWTEAPGGFQSVGLQRAGLKSD